MFGRSKVNSRCFLKLLGEKKYEYNNCIILLLEYFFSNLSYQVKSSKHSIVFNRVQRYFINELKYVIYYSA